MKIGIPRAGLYYKYYPFWKTFLKELGFEVKLSPPTDKKLLDEGLKIANSEMCLPMKVLYGHVVALQDEVDKIFLPIMDEFKWGEAKYGHGTYFCPYFVGLRDMMQAEFPDLEIFCPKMSFHNYEIESEPWLEFASEQGLSEKKAKKAFAKADKAYREFVRQVQEVKKNPLEILENKTFNKIKADKKICLVGRPYIVYDENANLDLIKRINKRGYQVETMDTLKNEEIVQALSEVNRDQQSHWQLTNEEYAAIIHFAKRDDVAGVIYLVPFNCGPDFLVDDLVISKVRYQKPITTISIDESTGEAGLATRLDAFIDMLK